MCGGCGVSVVCIGGYTMCVVSLVCVGGYTMCSVYWWIYYVCGRCVVGVVGARMGTLWLYA